jgi:hypothetical protein
LEKILPGTNAIAFQQQQQQQQQQEQLLLKEESKMNILKHSAATNKSNRQKIRCVSATDDQEGQQL